MATGEAVGERAAVLIVDDEAGVRGLLRAMLARTGEYEVFEASDAGQAQAFLGSRSVEVVVTDLAMPGMGGLELVQWAQQNAPGPQWIVLSGRASMEDAIRAVRLGAFDFLCKPIDAAEALQLTVRNAVRHGRLTAERERMARELSGQNERLRKQVRQLLDAYDVLQRQAQTISQDLERAELIQRALLPCRPPRIEPFAIDSAYRPSHKVGGDLYDVVPLNERHVAFYVADAAGHGVSAAMLAVLFKNRLLMYAADGTPRPPGQVLACVNDALVAECAGPGLFLTAAYALLDKDTGDLTVASAGHMPLLLQRAGGSQEQIRRTGPAVGMSLAARYEEHRVSLGAGDRLLIYTDGVLTARSPDQRPDVGFLFECLRATTGRGVLERLLGAARTRRDQADPSDDITLLLLESANRPSTIDNGSIQAAETLPAVPASRGRVLVGERPGDLCFAVQGDADWTHCMAFHDLVHQTIEGGRAVTLDLSGCTHLDSTFLGTILETVDHADQAGVVLRVLGLTPPVRRLFDELGMERVLLHAGEGMASLPSSMAPLEAPSSEEQDKDWVRILKAHEALAALGARNQAEFAGLIALLRAEAQQA